MKNPLPFVKMHGAGNDFVMIDGRDLALRVLTQKEISDVCDRRKGVGADGLIIVASSDDPSAAFRMIYFNSDGGEAEMCGNGARCAVSFAHQLGLVDKTCQFLTWHGPLWGLLVDETTVEVSLPPWFDLNLDLQLPEKQWPAYYSANTGVPHVVIPVENVDNVDVAKWGPILRYLDCFAPAGTNINWVSATTLPNTFKIRTYERGVESETLACGTGASACAVVLCHLKLCDDIVSDNIVSDNIVSLQTRGGDLLIVTVDTEVGALLLRGPAVTAFSGEVLVNYE